jgi:hypothetical protein
MSNQEAEFEQQRIQINRAELIKRMTRAVPGDGLLEPFPGIVLGRFSRPTEEQVYSMFKPSFCVIAQGARRARGSSVAERCRRRKAGRCSFCKAQRINRNSCELITFNQRFGLENKSKPNL